MAAISSSITVKPFAASSQRGCHAVRRGPTHSAVPSGRPMLALSVQRRLPLPRCRATGGDDAETEATGAAAGAAGEAGPGEEVYYEGSGAPAELAVNLLLAPTLLYLPLTLQSIGRRLWISYKFTNRRLVVTTNSPMLKREVQVTYDKVKEVRTVPRAFGLWGDMVVFLKDGSRLELVGIERHDELRKYMQARITA